MEGYRGIKELVETQANSIALPYKLRTELLSVRSVGVQGDNRTYGYTVLLTTLGDVMPDIFIPTLFGPELDYKKLAELSSKITNQIPEVNRVVLDTMSLKMSY